MDSDRVTSSQRVRRERRRSREHPSRAQGERITVRHRLSRRGDDKKKEAKVEDEESDDEEEEKKTKSSSAAPSTSTVPPSPPPTTLPSTSSTTSSVVSIPPTTTATSSLLSASSTTSSAVSTPPAITSAAQTSSTTTVPPTATADTVQSKNNNGAQSKSSSTPDAAAIAFAVIGSIAAVALLGFFLFKKYRKRRRNASGPPDRGGNDDDHIDAKSDTRIMDEAMAAAYDAEGGDTTTTRPSTPNWFARQVNKVSAPRAPPPEAPPRRPKEAAVNKWLDGHTSRLLDPMDARASMVSAVPSGLGPPPSVSPASVVGGGYQESVLSEMGRIRRAAVPPPLDLAMLEKVKNMQNQTAVRGDEHAEGGGPRPARADSPTGRSQAMTESTWNTWGVEQHHQRR